MRLSTSPKLNFFSNIIVLAAVLTYGGGIAAKHGFLIAGPVLFAEGFALAMCAIGPNRKSTQ
jgi:hypothetical protein